MKNYYTRIAAGVVVLVIMLSGCNPTPPEVIDQPTVPRGYYDVVFVEPQIVHSDSLFTLIRAQRKDSIFVRTNEVNRGNWAPALEFMVREDTCFVSLSLEFLQGNRPNLPLLARYLRKGFYKLTMNEPLKFGEEYYRGSYVVKGTACGRRVTLPVVK